MLERNYYGWRLWLDWHRAIAPDNELEIKALEAGRGSYLGYVRVVGRCRAGAKLGDPMMSVPAQYTRKPLLFHTQRQWRGAADVPR